MLCPSRGCKLFIGSLLLVTLLLTVSYHFADTAIALYVHHSDPIRGALVAVLGSLPGLVGTEDGVDVPDFLGELTAVLTAISWIGYFLRARLGIYDCHTLFLKSVAVALPWAFAAKTFAKLIFGRINTRIWVADSSLADGFHWFAGGGAYNGFPSGHMAVLTPLFVAIWCCYPRFRMLCVAGLTGLGLALIATGYHFLSDVIAGTYLGLLVYFGSYRWSSRRRDAL
jgi:membrane-associated phospholipid phosphatase